MKNSTLIFVLFLSLVFVGCAKSPMGPQTATVDQQQTATATATTVVTSVPTAVVTTVSTVVVTPVPTTVVTPIPTPIPTATATANLVYCYVKITGDAPSTASSFVLQIWVHTSFGNTYLFNGTAVIDSSNSYVWESIHSDGYVLGGASISCYILAAPANQGLYIEVHRIVNGVDVLQGSFHSNANQMSGAQIMF
jgi:hypothetical protein